VVHLDALHLVLDTDRLIFAFEIDHVERARDRCRGTGGVDDHLCVHLLVAVVPNALDDAVVVEDRPGHPRVEPVLGAALAAVRDEEPLEVGEL